MIETRLTLAERDARKITKPQQRIIRILQEHNRWVLARDLSTTIKTMEKLVVRGILESRPTTYMSKGMPMAVFEYRLRNHDPCSTPATCAPCSPVV